MKRSVIFTLLFSLATTIGFSQEHLELTVFGSPTFSYRMVIGDQDFTELLNDVHDPTFSYETGILATVKNTPRVALQTGLVFSRKAISFGEISLRDSNNDPMGSIEITMTSDFLEVPFRLNYYFSDAKKNYLIGGLSADFLLKAKYHYKVSGDLDNFEEEQPTGTRKVNTSLQIGYGIRLVESQQFGLDLEPNFKVQLLDAHTDTDTINMHYYTIGLACMFRFKL